MIWIYKVRKTYVSELREIMKYEQNNEIYRILDGRIFIKVFEHSKPKRIVSFEDKVGRKPSSFISLNPLVEKYLDDETIEFFSSLINEQIKTDIDLRFSHLKEFDKQENLNGLHSKCYSCGLFLRTCVLCKNPFSKEDVKSMNYYCDNERHYHKECK